MTPTACTENCVVVAEGEVGHDGVFKVAALGFPGCETRSELPATAQVRSFGVHGA